MITPHEYISVEDFIKEGYHYRLENGEIEAVTSQYSKVCSVHLVNGRYTVFAEPLYGGMRSLHYEPQWVLGIAYKLEYGWLAPDGRLHMTDSDNRHQQIAERIIKTFHADQYTGELGSYFEMFNFLVLAGYYMINTTDAYGDDEAITPAQIKTLKGLLKAHQDYSERNSTYAKGCVSFGVSIEKLIRAKNEASNG